MPNGFDFPVDILEQISPEAVQRSEFRGTLLDYLPVEEEELVSNLVDVGQVLSHGLPGDVARVIASGFRGECLSVRAHGVGGSEYLAAAAGWWAQQAVDFFGEPVRVVGEVNESINATVQDVLGIPGAATHPSHSRPRARAGLVPGSDGFLVQVPSWQDIFTFNNDQIFDERSRRERALDYAEALRRSPTPPSLREVGELLTTLDDLQDEASTLAVSLMIAEKLAGRVIPGVGWVATAADALSIIGALTSAGTGTGLPGRRGKRLTADKARHTSNGTRGRLERMRRVEEFDRIKQPSWLAVKPQIKAPEAGFKLGWGDLLQGLQATDSIFGTGIQIGSIIGFLQDSFWGLLRGAEFKARGPIWDPLGFTEAGRKACSRSPALEGIHPQAYFALANSALSVWSKSGRIMPYLDLFGEQALASTLTGLRLSEQVLGPWLRSGVWVEPLKRAVELTPFVSGGVEEHGTRRLRPDEWVQRMGPATQVGLKRAVGNVADRGRQAFYESLIASTAWGFYGSLFPAARVRSLEMAGPVADAFSLLDVNRIPVFDLED